MGSPTRLRRELDRLHDRLIIGQAKHSQRLKQKQQRYCQSCENPIHSKQVWQDLR